MKIAYRPRTLFQTGFVLAVVLGMTGLACAEAPAPAASSNATAATAPATPAVAEGDSTVSPDALNDEAAIRACFDKMNAGTFDMASPNGGTYVNEGAINCTRGVEKADGHRAYAVVGVTSYAADGNRLSANGDFIDRDFITVYQSGSPQISFETGGHNYVATIGRNGMEAYDPETDQSKEGAVEQGPIFGTGGNRTVVAVDELPPATQQTLTNAQVAAVKAQMAFVTAMAGGKH